MTKKKLTWHFYVIALVGIALVITIFLLRHSAKNKSFELAHAYSFIEVPNDVQNHFTITKLNEKDKTVNYDGVEIPSETVSDKISERQMDGIQQLTQLAIDQDVKMKYVNEIKNSLAQTGNKQLFFDARSDENTKKANINHPVFALKTFDWVNNTDQLKSTLALLDKIPNIIEVRYINKEKVVIKSNYLKKKEITTTLSKYGSFIESLVTANPNYVVKYYIDDKNTFGSYMAVLSLTKKAVDNVRQKKAIEHWGKPFNNLQPDQQEGLTIKYPFKVFEITADIQKLAGSVEQ